jgi:hypothetical protein
MTMNSEINFRPLFRPLTLALLGMMVVAFGQQATFAEDGRDKLGFAAMMAAETADETPINNRYFMPVGAHAKAKHTFSGTLSIPSAVMRTVPVAIEPTVIRGGETQRFPGVDIKFVTYKNFLVPTERNIIRDADGKSFWQVLVDPGRIWSEPGDRGFSRASFPFALTSTIENETYNGVATFLFNDDRVSHLRYQVVRQLTPYFVKTWFVASGHKKVTYTPGTVRKPQAFRQAFARELADRTPLRPWSELVAKYDATILGKVDGKIDPDKVLSSGLIVDGVIYAKPCRTPYGDYPYLYEMRHGMWSVTKSMGGMVTALRMAEKYGDEIFEYKIKDYLNVSATHDGWDKVTIGDALNMASGIGVGSTKVTPNSIMDGYMADTKEYDAWYVAPSNSEKLKYVFQNPNQPWGPGVHARYRDRDAYTHSASQASLLQSKEGPNANLWAMMLEEVFRPIGIHHLTHNQTIESDGKPGVPHSGWGLYMTLDDIAKISKLLQNGGMHEGKQLLSKTKLAEAMYQTNKRGLPTGGSNKFGKKTYHMSLWHSPYRTESGRQTSVAEMHGWGGILVMLMPNGVSGFRIGNGGTRSMEFIEAAHHIRSFDGKPE